MVRNSLKDKVSLDIRIEFGLVEERGNNFGIGQSCEEDFVLG